MPPRPGAGRCVSAATGGRLRVRPPRRSLVHAHRRLAASPCALLTATLEDVAAVRERPNQPGGRASSTNWSLALPVSRERLEALPLARELATILSRGGSAPGGASGQSARPARVN